MKRRQALTLIAITGTSAVASAQDPVRPDQPAPHTSHSSATGPKLQGDVKVPTHLNKHEFGVISRVADLTIPRDSTPGALDARVPEYIDRQLAHMPAMQTQISGGIQWLDHYCMERFGEDFQACAERDQIAVLDALSDGKNVPPAMGPGRAFFVQVRELTCDGFYSSKLGFQEVGFKGNSAVSVWTGCTHPEHRG